MANKTLFKSNRTSVVKATDTRNEAGGVAYSRTAESALTQYTVTGCLNQTYYSSAEEQVDKIFELANQVTSETIAYCAVYGHRVARMKDIPALLLAILAGRKETAILETVFPLVITNQKMLRNFVQILRSGRVGRKSFGTAIKRMIQVWLANKTGDELFKGSVGQSPSLADIVKMVHPRGNDNKEKNAFYGWLLGKEHNKRFLPKLLKQFEAFKSGDSLEVPDVDFRMLTAQPLSKDQWKQIGLNMPWNALRMNLNTLQRHGVFEDSNVVKELANKLRDEKLVRKANAFPYQLLTAFQNVEASLPMPLKLALIDAMETATENIPSFDCPVAVCIDTSGSMQSPVTGYRAGATTVTTCVDVAALIASCVARKNDDCNIVLFDTMIHPANFNPRDSIVTNAKKLARSGGGTDCSCALRHLNSIKHKGQLVIYVSDNESWFNSNHYYRGTGMQVEWKRYKERNPRAKLVCIDIVPNSTTQVVDDKDILNIGGFSDSVFEVIYNFVKNDSQNFYSVVEEKAKEIIDKNA